MRWCGRQKDVQIHPVLHWPPLARATVMQEGRAGSALNPPAQAVEGLCKRSCLVKWGEKVALGSGKLSSEADDSGLRSASVRQGGSF